MFETKITRLLGIKYPIFQGGMAWVATHTLAAAVSNAGGLGIIASGSLPGEIIREEIRQVKKLTNKPYGVNIMLMSPYAEDIVDIVCEEGVPVVTTGAGNPGKYIEKLRAHNVKIIPVVPTVSLARRLERQGVDAIIVEGTEAGGHIGEITTMALVPQVVDAVSIPVISAGGIADGRGFIAALALGAEGVQLGTRFVCSLEADVHQNFKEEIIKAGDRDALVTGRSTGHPIRVLKNKFAKEYLELEKNGSSLEELGKWSVGRLKLSVQKGDVEKGSLMAGQISGLVDEIKPCEDIIADIVSMGSETLKRLSLLNEVAGDE
ncbi:enoyl-[acyl-carrier-protein] reductase FabK [Tissierella creatinophila]|uniref:Probable nitronate monooxygenase n=1 Tax=Tissierella creatinophila DSM 6911 TaxID=1123403 RepID=A0A1U7M430_TISCR|nr:enoyl-[acyl-carrier-protein] reductase FabK [Tissierella creatinophila]OLS02072.1 nitronate monooxygenase [Tissierella creatinophila DSM 6911]